MAEIPEISATAAIDNTPGQRPHGGDRPAAAAQSPASLDSRGGPSAEISRAADAGRPTAADAAPETTGTNGLENARDRVEISPAAERAFNVLDTISQNGPQSLTANNDTGGNAGQALGQALRDSAPGQTSLRDDAPSDGISIDTDPTSRSDADPLAANQGVSAEIERAANGNANGNAGQALGQALRDSAPGQASLRDDAPSVGASIDIDPASRAEAAAADPLASNQNASTEIEHAGNDDLSQSEASRTLGQVVDVFA